MWDTGGMSKASEEASRQLDRIVALGYADVADMSEDAFRALAQPLIAALAATSLYNTAGEIAEKRSNGPGSFQVALLDALWNVTAEEVADRAIDMR